MAELRVYISISAEDRIATFGLHASGALTHRADFPLSGGPGPLALAPDSRTLYCSRRGEAAISSLALDPDSGWPVRETGSVSEASQSVYIGLDPTGAHLLSCCNGDGRVSAHRLASDGSILRGQLPTSTVHGAIGAHSVNADPSGRFVFVPHVGWDGYPLVSAGGTPAQRAEAKAAYSQSDAVYQFTFDSDTGTLAPNDTPLCHYEWMARGPRHMCFHPSLAMAYTTDEMSSTVTALALNTDTGELKIEQSVPMLPERGRWAEHLHAAHFADPASGNDEVLLGALNSLQQEREADGDGNSAAQLRIHPSGRWLYAPNRGHDTIACFAVGDDGLLSLIERVPTEPHTRGMALDPDGRYLLAAGVYSGAVSVYAVDEQSGRLRFVHRQAVGQSPMWIIVASATTGPSDRAAL